jgi:KaiC/GvpD/RAD55 family RecA-like ATPase
LIKFLLKNTAEIYVTTEEDANKLHKEVEQFAHDNGYTLSSWTQTYRCKKSKGEIELEWFVCKYVIIFNDAKEPEIGLKNIEFNMINSNDALGEE